MPKRPIRTSDIESIVDQKRYRGKVYYKVKFSNKNEDPIWLPASRCRCDTLIDRFKQDQNSCSEDAEEEWEVEQILDKRINNNQTEYLVKWRGWVGEATWTPADDCQCVNLIAAFENPKLKKMWDFQGSNRRLWIKGRDILRYMRRKIENGNIPVNLLKFEPDFPDNEIPLSISEGINMGPLCYRDHWYLVIILVNHICVTRKILVGDSLNTLIGTPTRSHPVVKRLAKLFPTYPIKPIRLTQMDRSDVCAFYTLAAFERALFLLDPNATLIVGNIYFDQTKAELIRSIIMPESDGQISVSLPIPEAFDHGPMCEFCEQMFESYRLVDKHILQRHFRNTSIARSVSFSDNSSDTSEEIRVSD